MGGHRVRQARAERALHDQTNILPRPQLLLVFSTLAATLLISFLDQNGVSVALPAIAADLGARNTISWAGTSSLVANTAFQMLYGRLSDIFGRKVVYLAAIGLLLAADLLCGLSRSAAMFYVFRGVAGIGGGGVTNLSMIIVSDVVTLEQRGKYQGITGAMIGLGNVCGPFLAAAFVERATWRAFFYTLAPLAAVVWATSFVLLPSKPPATGLRRGLKNIDYLGSLTSSIAVIFLLIPISGGILSLSLSPSVSPPSLFANHAPAVARWCVFRLELADGDLHAGHWVSVHRRLRYYRDESGQAPDDAGFVVLLPLRPAMLYLESGD